MPVKLTRCIPFRQFNSKEILVAVVAAGIALRISGFTVAAIWYDEAISFEAAKLSFFPMLDATRFTFSPPLWGVIVWASIRIFGQNEFGLRLPALIGGLLLIWAAYQATSDFRLSKHQKLVAMTFISLFPYQISMAQDGRMYTILSLLYLCALWFALRNRWLGLTGCSGLLLYTHYTAPFYLLALYAVAVLNNSTSLKHLIRIFTSGIVAILSFLPWLHVYTATLSIESPVPTLSAESLLIMFYRIIFDDTLTNSPFLPVAFFTIVASAAIGAVLLLKYLYQSIYESKTTSNRVRFMNRRMIRYLQLTIFSLLPLIIMVLWSYLWKNFIYYRLIASMLVPITIWMIYTYSRRPTLGALNFSILTIWVILISAGIIFWSPQTKSGNLRDVANFVNEQWQDGDLIYHITGTSYLPISQYVGEKPEYLLDSIQHEWLLPVQLQDRFKIVRKPLENIPYQRAWIFYSRDELISPQVNADVQKYIKNATMVARINVWRFSPIEVYILNTPVPQ